MTASPSPKQASEGPAPHAPLLAPHAPRWLPFAYFLLAHLCLALACEALAAQPQGFLGPWYQGRTLALVHLVTLGWITGSILGALYAFTPMAFRVAMPVRAWDVVVFVIYLVGATGVASHFWLEEPFGMAQSAAMTLLALGFVALKVWLALRAAPLPAQALLPVRLALANLLVAASFGVTLAWNRALHFLPGSVLANVSSHAHLAALGWATMLVLGFGQRLVPMLLPAAVPPPRAVAAIAVLFELGTLGLATALLFASPLAELATGLFATFVAIGLLLALAGMAWMIRNPKPRPPALPRPDWGILHVGLAMVCLLASVALGLYLAWSAPDDARLRWVPVYAVLGLLGFLGSMIVGISARMLPTFVWLRAFGGRPWPVAPPPPHALVLREVQPWCWLAWLAGIAGLVLGLARADPRWVQAGGYALLLAALLDTIALCWLAMGLRGGSKARAELSR